jgi:hypothetical protein
LFAAFSLGAYMNAIVKTHAPTSLLIVGALWVLTTSVTVEARLAIASGLGALATATRLSMIAFALTLFWLGVRDPRSRRAAIVISVALGTCVLAVIATNPDGAMWGLRDFHVEQWTATGPGRIAEIFTERLPKIALILGPPAALAAIAWRHREQTRALALLRVFGIATGLYAAVHLVTGQWHDEYLVPAVCASIPLASAMATRIEERWQIVAVTAVAVAMIPFGLRFIDIEDGRLPLDRASDVAAVVAAHTAPDDEVFALSALWAAVEADRDSVPGTELLNAGITRTSVVRATELRVLTPEDIVRTLATADVRVVVITSSDRSSLEQVGGAVMVRALDGVLAERYIEKASFEHVGQSDGPTKVYVLSPSRAP